MPLSQHLRELEAESIFVLREVAAECTNPVLMYSIGKDSSVLAHLARKAFHPAPPPFPLLHIDTTWKFKEMIAFRDAFAQKHEWQLIVHTNRDGVEQGLHPLRDAHYTHEMKTVALKRALTEGKYDAVIGGARRDEERSRAKERMFSFRDAHHTWDPKNQRPELWNVYNTRVHRMAGESMRVFPLSNWTERDIWEYIRDEGIEVVPLYFAKERPVARINDQWIYADDDRLNPPDGTVVETKMVRFRTLGCYPLSAAMESSAQTVEDILREMESITTSERAGRVIDQQPDDSMEDKKRSGYF